MSLDAGYQGALFPDGSSGEYNELLFVIRSLLAKMNTATLVKVTAVTNAGGIYPVGSVDVQPLVNQLDGNGNAVAHGIITNVPYVRMQGGSNAMILDPEIGDIGIAVFAQNDISSVKKSKAAANPGSHRRFHWSDSLYIGGLLNGTPTQYIAFASSGISIKSSTAIILDSPSIQIAAPAVQISASGNLTISGTSIAVESSAFTWNGLQVATVI